SGKKVTPSSLLLLFVTTVQLVHRILYLSLLFSSIHFTQSSLYFRTASAPYMLP
ncbi:hypothetical protein Ddye_006431, partial [Dipteronia dyeriana]